MSEINSYKLGRLHAHLQRGGATDLETIKDVLKVSSEPLVIEYREALVAKYPEIYREAKTSSSEEGDAVSDEGTEEIVIGASEDEPEVVPAEPPASRPQPTPSPKPPTNQAPKKTTVKRYFLTDANGTARELDLKSENSGGATFALKQPKDEVQILIKGQAVTIDLEDLRRRPADQPVAPYDIPASRLIALGELAKG